MIRTTSFWQWLRHQHRRNDRVGDLARDARADENWPRRARRLETLDLYLHSVNACDGAHGSLLVAHEEWMAEEAVQP